MNGGLDKIFYPPDLPDEYELVKQKQTEIASAIEELFKSPLYLHHVYNNNFSKKLITDSSDFPSEAFGLHKSAIGHFFQYNCKLLNKI